MKLYKITNPLWLTAIAPRVDEFIKKIDIDGITYDSMMVYLRQCVQFGGTVNEFWVVVDEEPVAFANFGVRGLPHIGKVMCDYIYSWSKSHEPVMMLMGEFAEFGKRNRCLIYEGDAISEFTFRAFRKAASKLGYELKKRENIQFMGRKK
jgi:hypothetical protein